MNDQELKMKKNLIFYSRLFVFLLFSLIIPIVYIYTKFKLYQSKITISLWGFIVLIIAFVVFASMIKFYIKGLKTKYSIIKQILGGLIKIIIPLVLILMFIVWFNDKIDLIVKNLQAIKETLILLIPCEMVAIVVNPLPQWCFENNIEGVGEILDKIIPAKKGEE